jgi:nitrogen PTS system EIIA component
MDKLFIGVRELAGKMGVSEKTIYRLLNDNQIPFAVKIGGQWRFRIDVVDNWLSAQYRGDQGTGRVNYGVTVFQALHNGSILYRIHGKDRDEALDEVLTAIPHDSTFDIQNIKLSVLARESFVSSCLARFACMAAGCERPVYIERSLIILAFLEVPADFKALDGEPCEVIFLVLGANAVEQAILDTRLRRLMMEREFIDGIRRQPRRKEILNSVEKLENTLLKKKMVL